MLVYYITTNINTNFSIAELPKFLTHLNSVLLSEKISGKEKLKIYLILISIPIYFKFISSISSSEIPILFSDLFYNNP